MGKKEIAEVEERTVRGEEADGSAELWSEQPFASYIAVDTRVIGRIFSFKLL